jgi:hypothetical protein
MMFIERVKRLGLPLDEVLIIGSGVIDVLQLREADDIDMVVTERLFKELHGAGDYTEKMIRDEVLLEKDDQEIGVMWGYYKGELLDFSHLVHHSIVMDGVRFVDPEFLLHIKIDRNRSKDQKDIQLLKQYLNTKNTHEQA